MITILAFMVLTPLGLLSYVVGKASSPRIRRWCAALLIGLPTALLVAVLGPFGRPDATPQPPVKYGNPYKPGSVEYAQYNQGKGIAAALAKQGKNPGSGMSDDIGLWCEDQLAPVVGSGDAIPEAMAQGCSEGAG
ncbi:hypothetical protein [Streptomyces sp. NPDC048442]|uniref:hypothetical protein n=1 Tax=Streptomyces sp. NPDC048442 TaxID=3154823 RepID=UPI0034469B8F